MDLCPAVADNNVKNQRQHLFSHLLLFSQFTVLTMKQRMMPKQQRLIIH
ncbi:hypothetical protein NC652_016653 [Populus alba x Populus x berolinensis]|nr:hypothetical protein NC652_016653 [Populus alba x Populus x berolinensis]